MNQWIAAGARDDIEKEDVVPFDHGGRNFGRSDYRCGAAKGTLAGVGLKTYPAKVESGKIFIDLG